MASQLNQTQAPQTGRTVLIAPGRRINLAGAGHPLATIQPTTQLGAVALNLAMQTSTATIQIIATSTYVNSLTALQLPNVTFGAPPPGTQGITVEELKDAYDGFRTELAMLQGLASTWISGSGGSIFSTLVSVARTIGITDSQVQSYLRLLTTMPAGPDRDQIMSDTISMVGTESQPLFDLKNNLNTLATNLNTAADSLVTAATTGVLAQLQTAFQNEISKLTSDIAAAQSTISSDKTSIEWLGVGAAASIVLGIVGLLNFWNPAGWVMLGGGIAGAYFAITKIETLKGEIAALKQEIQADWNTVSADRTAAQGVAIFAQAAQGAAALNGAAQQEINALVELCSTLRADIQAAVQDLNDNDIPHAVQEWNDVVAAAAFLGGITAYIWPSWIQLANPTSLSAAGNNAYLVSNSGTVFRYTVGGNTWTALPDYSLSAVASGAGLYAIDGAPATASKASPNPYGQSFTVKVLQGSADTWQSLGDMAVAQIAANAGSLYAIKQDATDRQAYEFAGGTSWNPLGPIPGGDVPGDIACYDGTLFALANNGGGLWYMGSSGWKQIGSATYSRMSANGSWLGLVDPKGAAWVVSLATPGNYNVTYMGSSVTVVAQAPDGDQYIIDEYINLWHIAYNNGGIPTSTLLRSKVVGVAVSDGGTVYATDNAGSIWMLTDLAGNAWQQLPAVPTN